MAVSIRLLTPPKSPTFPQPFPQGENRPDYQSGRFYLFYYSAVPLSVNSRGFGSLLRLLELFLQDFDLLHRVFYPLLNRRRVGGAFDRRDG